MRYSFYFFGVVITLGCGSLVYGWGGPTHAELAEILLNDPVIAPLVPASCNVDTVTAFIGEPPDSWHHPGWPMIKSRGYLTNYGGNQNWPSLDQTTRVKYLIHIATDCGVPLGHSPAREVHIDTIAEAAFEAQVATWASYPGIVGTSSYSNSKTEYATTFSGTYPEVVNKFYPACLDNAKWFKSTPEPWYLFGAHSTDDNRSAGRAGTSLGLHLGRVMLADLFLAEKPTIANANGNYTVKPGGSVTLSSAGSLDPDSITWNASGNYTNNGGGFNCDWDLNGDGTYETTGASPKLTHAQLVSLVGYTEGKTIKLRVADTDPGVYQKTATDTATIAVYSKPTVVAQAEYSVRPGKSVRFLATGNDQDGGGITQWLWDLDADGQYDDLSGTGSLTYDQIIAKGVSKNQWCTIKLKVVDNEGQVAYDSARLSVGLPGDANGDGKVDGSDLTILAGNWQAGIGNPNPQTITWAMGDFNGDGKIDGSDVTILAHNWQYGIKAAATSVPESSVIGLISWGLTPLLFARQF